MLQGMVPHLLITNFCKRHLLLICRSLLSAVAILKGTVFVSYLMFSLNVLRYQEKFQKFGDLFLLI